MARIDKINNSIKREISRIIQEEIKDPRIGFITITMVETSRDLSLAKVHFSVLGDSKRKAKAQEGLGSCAGFIRRLLSQRLSIRRTPELLFKLDRSTEYSINIIQKIERIKDESKKNSNDNQ